MLNKTLEIYLHAPQIGSLYAYHLARGICSSIILIRNGFFKAETDVEIISVRVVCKLVVEQVKRKGIVPKNAALAENRRSQ